MFQPRKLLVCLLASLGLLASAEAAPAADEASTQWLTLAAKEGPGKGKHVVLIAAANEYEPAVGLPMLAKILAERHGFACTVLFSINKAGEVDPNANENVPGLAALERADLMVILARFRTLPPEQMAHVVKYLEAGRPVVGLRTATHSFAYKSDAKDPYVKYRWDNKDPAFEGGFGRQVLGETWITHHAPNGKTSTRGLFAPGAAESPILRGIEDGSIHGTTGVYGIRLPLPADCKPLVMGQVIEGGKPDGKAVEGRPNDPMMPVVWTRTYSVAAGKTGRAFTTTMGSAADLENESFRRLMVNGCYWAAGLEDAIPAKADVAPVGATVKFRKGMKPGEFR